MGLLDGWVDWLGWWRRPYLSREELAAYQSAKLRRIVRHAAAQVPYYRNLFTEAGLTAEDVASLDDLKKIPISSKADFANRTLDERLSDDVDTTRLIPHVTSGSTGALLEIRRSRWEELRVHSFQFRAQLLAGLRPSDCRAFLGDAWDRKLYHRAGLFRLQGIGSNPDPDEALRRLRLLQPEVIVGHPSLLEMMLRSPHREDFARLRPRLLFTGAEMLSPHARQTYEATFQCPAIDFYGAHEVGHIACQCRSCGLYHTCDDSVIVEVLREGQPAGHGEDGEIVVTSLHSEAMPIIRYRLGDVVRRPRSSPECPIGFGTIENIQGRTLDYLDLSDGRRINPYTVVEKLAALPGVVCFEVTQDDLGEIQVRFEAVPRQQEIAGQAMAAACEELFPHDQLGQVKIVHELPLMAGGKRRYIRTNRAFKLRDSPYIPDSEEALD